MDQWTLKFEIGRYVRWTSVHDGMQFKGEAGGKLVTFVATAEALAYLLNADRDHVDALTAAGVFADYEADLYRIAQQLYRQRVGEHPILLRREDVG